MAVPESAILKEILTELPSRFFSATAPHLLAVSGGRDSMLLLHLFAHLKEEGMLPADPLVFHLNHGLRPEADREEQLVRSECEGLGFEFQKERVNLREYARSCRLNLEEAGRLLRYRTFARIIRERGGGTAVTGHHAGDYLESLLMHLIRGGGPAVLRTMDLISSIEGVRVFRPLLFLDRPRINVLLERHSIPWLDDSSNEDETFLRNRLRRLAIPLLTGEGLDPVRLWRNHHLFAPQPTPAAPRYRHLALDRRCFVNASPGEIKALLDPALRRMGLSPVAGGVILEMDRQLRARGAVGEFRLHLETAEFLLWSARQGAVWILSRDSPLFRPFELQDIFSTRENCPEPLQRVSIHYGGRVRTIALRDDEEVISFRPGLRLPVFHPTARSGESTTGRETLAFGTEPGRFRGTKKLKKLFQELRLPPPVRRNLPLLFDGKRGVVTAVLTGFWEDQRDRFFRI